MHELACPSCNSPHQYDLRDTFLLCPFCSATFAVDMETGVKQVYGEHFIIPNMVDGKTIRELVIEWLKRIHHKPGQVDKEFFVVDLQGLSVPYWVVSAEVHTTWKGLIKKARRSTFDLSPGSDFIGESGTFRRSYRWCVSARSNICESWGMARLHEPKEAMAVEWDGFPLDSTMSRGKIIETANEKPIYDVREFFDFKFANSLKILGIQVGEEEALRRARHHLELYHWKLARLNVDYLVDHRSEVDVAGVQLIHMPFWFARYAYRPSNALRYIVRTRERSVMIDGYGRSMLKGELAIIRNDKMIVNAIICAVASIVLVLLGLLWHPAFFFVAIFGFLIAGASAAMATGKKKVTELEEEAAKLLDPQKIPA